MNILAATKTLVGGRTALACGAAVAALGALAQANHAAARRAEREHPPEGSFMEVDGVRLHYSDRGTGQPIVLIHGNAVSGDDYDTSGVAELLLETNRVIVFDRPGFGHSERPRGRAWTAMQQAELLHKALKRLGIERPVVVGHSWGRSWRSPWPCGTRPTRPASCCCPATTSGRSAPTRCWSRRGRSRSSATSCATRSRRGWAGS